MIANLLPMAKNVVLTIVRALTTYENRITSYVVLTGIGLLTVPLWGQFLAALLAKHFNIEVDLTPSQYVGVILILAALIFRLAWEWRPVIISDPNLEHDTRVTVRFKNTIDYNLIKNAIYNMETGHFYYREEVKQLNYIIDFFQDERNNYTDPKTNNFTDLLLSSTIDLRNFIACNFFVFPENQRDDNLRFRMHPELNIDTGYPTPDEEAKYARAADDVGDLIDTFLENFRAFIMCLNKRGIDFY